MTEKDGHDAYIAAAPEQFRPVLRLLRSRLSAALPDAQEAIKYGMPGFQIEGTIMLRRFRDQDLTLVDAYGLHLMRDGHVTSCWSTDRHLGLTGTPLAIPAT